MKKYFFIFSSFVFLTSIILLFFIVFDSINYAKAKMNEGIHQKRIKEYNLIIKENRDYLFSIAKYFANYPLVKKAYKENNPNLIYNEFLSLFNIMHKKNLIEELHFFKYPAVNFLDFPNDNTKMFDVSKKRLDILNIETAKKPDVFYYICAKYPGFRAVFPIEVDSKIVGSVSFAQNIDFLINRFKLLGVKKISILLNDKLLKFSLMPKFYKSYKKCPLIENKYRLLGDKIEKNRYFITKIDLKDYFGNELGKIILADRNEIMFKDIVVHILGYVFIFVLILLMGWFFYFRMLNYVIKELNKTDIYVKLLKNQEFDKLPKTFEVKNEINAHQKAIIDAAKEIKAFINILRSKNEEYYNKAYIDVLTGAFNRRFLEEKEHELFLKYKTLKKQVSVLMFDIDDFKKVNDTYGHDVGDMVLSEIGEIVRGILRKDDIFIRYGGEEFVIILEDVKLKEAIKIAEKLRKAIEEEKIKINDEKEISVSVSIGISELNYETDNNLFDTIKRADEKLYIAKRNGKNRWEV
ncbi:diguanylate cyclase [Lebetimonas sp. JS085]|uniref:sensor domain-containing diguanylate cyclase n=1 Tax=Lebetimonas sp. JS085 TaxID=931222 RepID=UPI000463A842|nr:diguanylate cyclase [Lebetimonas sp. JS085]